MKKKILSFMLAICLIIPAIMFVGCGKNPPEDKKGQEYVGSYQVVSYADSEVDVTKEQYETNPSDYDEWDISGWFEMTIKLNQNYTFEQHQEGSTYVQNGSWSVVGQKIKIMVENEVYFELAIVNDSTLTLAPYSDNTTLTLTKM